MHKASKKKPPDDGISKRGLKVLQHDAVTRTARCLVNLKKRIESKTCNFGGVGNTQAGNLKKRIERVYLVALEVFLKLKRESQKED